MPASAAARKPTWRRCWPRRLPGPLPISACRPTAASASPRSTTSSASIARRGSIRWRRSRPTSSSPSSPSTCSACRAATEPSRMKPLLFGPSYSVYVRIAKIVLAEKRVDYEQVEFDDFDRNDWPADWPQRQPFGLVPAFEHDGFRLYESRAITRYVDEAFAGPRPLGRAPCRERVCQYV